MFSAFQHNGYQANAYQIVRGIQKPVTPAGGRPSHGGSYHLSKHDWHVKEFKRLENEREQAKLALDTKEREIAALELKRKEALADQAMQMELIALFEQAQILQAQRDLLAAAWRRFMQEEEDIFIILSCLPFS